MTTTQQRDAAIEAYKIDLDYHLRRLPRQRRNALRLQILEHLDEATSDADSPDEVRAALDRLGPPAALVDAELADIGGRSSLLAAKAREWGWRRWVVVAVVLAALGSLGGYALDMRLQPDLRSWNGTYTWVDRWDRNHSHDVTSLTGSQSRTPIHPGHRQGFIFPVYNGSGWPQTILGPGPNESGLGTDAMHQPDIAVGVGVDADRGSYVGLDFTPTATIKPGHAGYVRVTWRTQPCRLGRGAAEGGNTVQLQVKVGWFTRSETIDLGQYFVLTGHKSAGCGHGH